MNLDIAVLLPWILATVLVVAVVYTIAALRRERARAESLLEDQRKRDEALERFAGQTMPAITDAVRRYEQPTSTIEVPTGLQNSRLAQCLQWIGDRYADDLRMVQAETRERAAAEADAHARQAIHAAEEAVRAEVGAAARDATSGAVRSFGTSVVSLGADVSQVVSAALRQHRNDDVYATLTRIDHTVQQMIRQAQSYVIVCGGLPGRRWPAQSLTDVVGGATGRVRDYLRVRTTQLDRVVVSRAVEPLVHTLATLLDNALRYSPPTSFVDVSFQEGHHGVTVIIDDAGVRMNAEQMEEARQVLANERPVDIHQLGPSPKVGFPGVAALARRYGFTVYIDGPNAYGGMRAMVYIPEALLAAPSGGDKTTAATPAEAPAPAPEPAPAPRAEEPEDTEFTVHEITEGGLPKRRRRAVAPAIGTRARTSGDPAPARPEIAAAWHTGSKSGRAAAAEHTEGMTS
ncbi:Signal transduction histidine kinase [Nocardia amikacinitolerans]|uniref:ATP-binding protein n=1 Tax=Nocardia amikacinitolerans TaxID=756689 RepID=UPI0020A2ACC8|nr:ATP-binding protein [Nocardia amikacinitolerans]MCP2293718.1 Signal transduction histidine kinase [Nocardia amikacinitolerans]